MELSKSVDNALNKQIRLLKEHGVVFHQCDETEAKEYLANNNYLFRVKRFERNFDVDENGILYGLDFAVLKDQAILDYELRLFVEYITLNVEHALKLRFNRLIMENPPTSGTNLARLLDPRKEFTYNPNTGFNNLGKIRFFPYTNEFVFEYLTDPEIWNLWEVCSFADLIDFYRAYLNIINYRDDACKLLANARNLRNAASHNIPILLTLGRTGYIPRNDYVSNCLKVLFGGTVPKPLPTTIKKSQLIYDFTGLLCVFLITCNSRGTRLHASVEANKVYARIKRSYSKYYYTDKHCQELRNILGGLAVSLSGFCNYLDDEATGEIRKNLLHYSPVRRV